MILDPFLTLGYVEDIKVLVQPSNTVPYWRVTFPFTCRKEFGLKN